MSQKRKKVAGNEADSDNQNIVIEREVLEEVVRVGSSEWCKCGSCSKEEEREIDCLCCQEVAAINDNKFDGNFALLKKSI